MLDTWDTVKLPEGGTTRVQRRRKSTIDSVKRLTNSDANGVYQAAEVVVDGAEMPASIFPWKNSLYLTCVGKLERWSDEDGDGKFEQRTILADGFCGFYHHWLSGMTLGADGWLYLPPATTTTTSSAPTAPGSRSRGAGRSSGARSTARG